MEIIVKTEKPLQNISITNSYAPHNGYNVDTIDKYWIDVRSHLENINRKHIKLRCTDNNGQIHNDGNNNNVGKWTIANALNDRNGKELYKITEQMGLTASNTHFMPKYGDKNKLATWYNYDSAIRRQIDYFLISNTCKKLDSKN